MGKKNENKSFLSQFADSLIDIEKLDTREEQKRSNAIAVKNEIERGASADSLADLFRYEQLKDALSYYKVPKRSELTRLKDMSIALVTKFGKGNHITKSGTSLDVEYDKLKKYTEMLEKENKELKFRLDQIEGRKKDKKKKDKKKKKNKLK